jgi:hypothetical protein
MVAFHYPPMRGSSGLQRSLTFANELPHFGWETRVLTAHPRAYPETSADQLADVAPGVRVLRAPAWDAARHFAVRGAYPRALALPDRWRSWATCAVPRARWEMRRWRPDVIWSTFPIPSAHVIARRLSRATGIPWVADLRDSMTEDAYPIEPRVREAYLRIEREVARHAAAVVFTAPSTLRMYDARYPGARTDFWRVIGNGYDERKFREAEARAPAHGPRGPQRWLHSGLLDPVDRDPVAFFDAVASLRRAHVLVPERVQIVLRASGHDAHYARQLAERGIDDVVRLEPAIPYADALAEMLSADALLLFQAANCNHQIPAKLYEYFRARRPVLCLTDPAGDTAAEARDAGIGAILHLHRAAEIETGLRRFVAGVLPGEALLARPDAIERHSRTGQSRRLAELLDAVVIGAHA